MKQAATGKTAMAVNSYYKHRQKVSNSCPYAIILGRNQLRFLLNMAKQHGFRLTSRKRVSKHQKDERRPVMIQEINSPMFRRIPLNSLVATPRFSVPCVWARS